MPRSTSVPQEFHTFAPAGIVRALLHRTGGEAAVYTIQQGEFELRPIYLLALGVYAAELEALVTH